MNNRVTNIYIAENIPSLNKGEMTILGGMLESFGVLGEVKVSMISEVPEIDKLRYEPEVKIIDVKRYFPISKAFKNRNFIIRLFDSLPILFLHILFLSVYKIFGQRGIKIFKSDIWQSISKADVIVFGHNGTFGLGFGNPIVLYPLFIPGFAKLLKKTVVFYGGSLPELKTVPFPLNRIFSSALLKADFITLREKTSYQYIKEAKFKGKKTLLTADPAFLLRPVSNDRVREILKIEEIDKSSGPLIGFTIKQRMASKVFPDLSIKESYNRHVVDMAKIADYLIDNLNANIIFLPHCIGYWQDNDDRIIANQIKEQSQNKSGVKVITNEYSAAELKGLMGECDLLIGERVHSVVNSLTMCVPSVVMVSASDQRSGIIEMLGQEQAIFSLENQSFEHILARILQIWHNREEIHSKLIDQVATVQKKAMQNGELIKEILDSRSDM